LDRHHFNTVFEGLILSRLRYALPVRSVILSAELAGQINSFLKHAHKYGFSNKIQSVDEIAKETDEMLFFKMKCKQHCLNPTLPPLKPTLMAFVQGDIPMSFQNVGFSSAIIRALSGVYTDTYGMMMMMMRCIVVFLFLCDLCIM